MNEDEKQPRFSNRPLKLKEAIWSAKAGNGDWEAVALFLESRCIDPTLDVRELEIPELEKVFAEALEGIEQSNALQAIVKITLQ